MLSSPVFDLAPELQTSEIPEGFMKHPVLLCMLRRGEEDGRNKKVVELSHSCIVRSLPMRYRSLILIILNIDAMKGSNSMGFMGSSKKKIKQNVLRTQIWFNQYISYSKFNNSDNFPLKP
jgi:hypothetical protein